MGTRHRRDAKFCVSTNPIIRTSVTNHGNRLVVHRIEKLQRHVSANVPAAHVDHLGGEIHGVALAEEARRVGNDHHVFSSLYKFLETAILEGGVVGHALHLPLGERVGHGEADIDIAALVGAQLRIEEGGFRKIGADLLGRFLCTTSCSFSGHRSGFNPIGNHSQLHNSFVFRKFSIKRTIALHPHTVNNCLGTITPIATHAHHLAKAIVARARIREELKPVFNRPNGVVQKQVAIIVLAETSPPRKCTEVASGTIPWAEEIYTVVVMASQSIQRHVVHRAQELSRDGLPVFVGQTNLILLLAARQGLVTETQELESDVFRIIGDRDRLGHLFFLILVNTQQMDAQPTDVVFRYRIGDRVSLPSQVHPLGTHLYVVGVNLAENIRFGQKTADGKCQRLPDIDGMVHRDPQRLVRTAFLAVITIY